MHPHPRPGPLVGGHARTRGFRSGPGRSRGVRAIDKGGTRPQCDHPHSPLWQWVSTDAPRFRLQVPGLDCLKGIVGKSLQLRKMGKWDCEKWVFRPIFPLIPHFSPILDVAPTLSILIC